MDKETTSLLLDIIQQAEEFGLEPPELYTAKYFLKHSDYAPCFNAVVTQVNEFALDIDAPFYALVEKAATLLGLPETDYDFLKKLVRSVGTV